MKREEIIGELEKIRREDDGILRPERVVEVATDPGHPLHQQFEWDDTIAGQQWRLQQARHMINVCVTIIPKTETANDVYVSLVSDRTKAGGGYRTMVDVLSKKELREQLLGQALTELDEMERKYHELKELAGVFAAARKVRHDREAKT
jgi:hypothetical protein